MGRRDLHESLCTALGIGRLLSASNLMLTETLWQPISLLEENLEVLFVEFDVNSRSYSLLTELDTPL